MKRTLTLLTALLLTPLAALHAANAPAATRPNVVLIISDDHAWTDYRFMGGKDIQTPSIDRLAKEGLTFTRGYVTSALCIPSLATILTGLHPHQHGITGNDPDGTQPREPWLERLFRHPLLPQQLADSGYLTLHTGKYWMRQPAAAGFTDGMGDTDRHGGSALANRTEIDYPWAGFVMRPGRGEEPCHDCLQWAHFLCPVALRSLTARP